ncbi:MAG: TetR/AcrR family transcriptional regulator [Candidatus Sumerlaeia bacterium]|nr:TetR/AcrR family transcriptional regulator [Candidatus Sumerlaeia bacterium]
MAAGAARQRILDTAIDLFYRQGYRATGINLVIAESGVAKATLYEHFPSKDDLLAACVREMARREIAEMRQAVVPKTTARERFFAPFGILQPWFEASQFRGCPFQNIVAECPPDDPRVREAARQHRENFRALLREVSFDLLQEHPNPRGLDPTELADLYLVLYEGAIAVSVAYRDAWPVRRAIQTLEVILEAD